MAATTQTNPAGTARPLDGRGKGEGIQGGGRGGRNVGPCSKGGTGHGKGTGQGKGTGRAGK